MTRTFFLSTFLLLSASMLEAQTYFTGTVTYESNTEYTDEDIRKMMDNRPPELHSIDHSIVTIAADSERTLVKSESSVKTMARVILRKGDQEEHYSVTTDVLKIMSEMRQAILKDTLLLQDTLRLTSEIEAARQRYTSCKTCVMPYQGGNQSDDIRYLPGTETILGHECKKAIVTNELGDETTVWYTDKIPPLWSRDAGWKQLKGFPLFRQFEKNGQKITMTAILYDPASPAAEVFAMPPGCQTVTEEEYNRQ